MATSILGVSKKALQRSCSVFFFFDWSYVFLYGFSGSSAHMKLLLDRSLRSLLSIFHISGTDLFKLLEPGALPLQVKNLSKFPFNWF